MGRKSLKDEVVQANVINLSWLTISRALNSKTLTEKEKREISLEIVKKSCPKEINLKGEAIATKVYTIIGQMQRNFDEGRMPSMVLDSGNGIHEG